jgi:hypothetical protein
LHRILLSTIVAVVNSSPLGATEINTSNTLTTFDPRVSFPVASNFGCVLIDTTLMRAVALLQNQVYKFRAVFSTPA